jgi:anti-sigma regulatory factor (Ser/Thr protein kinase)
VAVLGLHRTRARTAPHGDEPPTRSITQPSEPGAARTARRFVEESLRAWQLDDNDHLAELLTDELVSNVVRHVGSPMQVRASRAGASIRIEVDDASTDPPIRRTPEELDEHGRGILLVETIASEWGVDIHDGGKTIWFEIPARVSDPPPPHPHPRASLQRGAAPVENLDR